MLQKTKEGNDVLDSVFLQVASEGKGLNAGHIRAALNKIENGANSMIAKLAKAQAQRKAECKVNVAVVRSNLFDLMTRYTTLARWVSDQKRAVVITETIRDRVHQEEKNARNLVHLMKAAASSWAKFWSLETKTYRRIVQLLGEVHNHVQSVSGKKAALLEMPASYKNSLAELQVKFAGFTHELNGMRPVIQNLLEVSADMNNINNDMIRAAISQMYVHVMERLNDEQNSMVEWNAHQNAMFLAMGHLANSAQERADKTGDMIEAGLKVQEGKVKFLEKVAGFALANAGVARTVSNDVRAACRLDRDVFGTIVAEHNRVNDVISQVHAVVNDRFGAVHAFFIEKMEREN